MPLNRGLAILGVVRCFYGTIDGSLLFSVRSSCRAWRCVQSVNNPSKIKDALILLNICIFLRQADGSQGFFLKGTLAI